MTDRPIMPLSSVTPQSPKIPIGFHAIDQFPNIFGYTESDGQYVLIDRDWSLGALPLQMARKTYIIPHHGFELAVTADVLRSTDSDIRAAILDEDYADEDYADEDYADDRSTFLSSALATLGDATPAVLRLILYYMQSGRFNSAQFNDGKYSVNFSTIIVQHAILSNMPIITRLALLEMHREFFGLVVDPATPRKLADLTLAQITHLANTGGGPAVWKALFAWAVNICQYPHGRRMESKQAIKATLQGKGLGGKTLLNKVWPRHVKRLEEAQSADPEALEEGELAWFREMVRVTATRRDDVDIAMQEDHAEAEASNRSGDADDEDSDIDPL